MNTDIRLAIGFWHHPKTKRLIRQAGLEGVRSLQILWCWVAQYRPDGNISDLDPEDIEAAADWNGEPGRFYEAIHERWLEVTPDGLFIHDWGDHNSWAAEADDRSNESRLLKLAQVNKEVYDALVAQGCKGISKQEYAEYKKLQANSDALAARNSDTLAERLRCRSGPAPAPSPVPIPSPVPVRGKDTHTGAPPDALPADAGESASEPQPGDANGKAKSCPQQEIVDLYHELLPELPRVLEWSPERQALLRARWKEKRERQDLTWWREFFLGVRDQPFLMGQGEKPWNADLEWLIRPKNMPKVIEGRYRARASPMDGKLSRAGQATYRNMMSILEREKQDAGS